MEVPREPNSYGFNELFEEPERNLVAALIYTAVADAEADIESQKWPHHIRIMGCYKRQALAFIFSEDLKIWIQSAHLPIDPKALREKLLPELEKMPRVEELILLNSEKTAGRPRKDKNKLIITEIEGGGLVK